MSVPLMNTTGQYESMKDEVRAAILDVVDSGRFVLGPNVGGFEQDAASFLGVKRAVGVGNGTDALVIALRALGIGAGDEVICPSYTFYATPESIAAVGATPVFAEVDEQTWTLDPEAVERVITPRTKAIMPVHLFGQPADMDALNAMATAHDLAVIEDSAQSWGARYKGQRSGTIGDVGTFSFYPTKNLGGFGDGGLAVTNSDQLADAVKVLRFHGSTDKVTFTQVGYNSRLDEIQATVLRIFLKHIDTWNEQRGQVAQWYREAGLGELVGLPHHAEDRDHIYHLYVARTPHRDQVLAALKERGVGAAIYYGSPLHLQPVFSHLGGAAGDFPVTEAMGREGLALPMFPTMTKNQVDQVVEAVKAAVPAAVV